LPLGSGLFLLRPEVTFPGRCPPVGHIEVDGLGQLIGGNEAGLASVVVEPNRVNRFVCGPPEGTVPRRVVLSLQAGGRLLPETDRVECNCQDFSNTL
jgi:hypothetical protein